MHGAARQPPHEIGIDRAEGEFAAFGAGARAGDIVEYPGDLGGAEIRIEPQACALAHQSLAAFSLQFGAGVGGAPVLPDDGVVDGIAAPALPDERGLALIGQTDRCDRARRLRRLGERLAHRGQRRAPDRLGIVFDPAGVGIKLRELLLRDCDRRRVGAEHQRAGGGRSLIDDEDVRFQPTLRRYSGR
jgi:hypothetical protein